MPHYIRVNAFNGLHGRALPAALGMRIANPDMKVIVESGDGDTYGEGGNHLLHNIRRNPDISHLVHNNQIYGLTKARPLLLQNMSSKQRSSPGGVKSDPFNPVLFAVAMKASLWPEHLLQRRSI